MNTYIRSQFPIVENLTYLNSAAVSPVPQRAIDAVAGQLADVARWGSEHFGEWVATKERSRVLLAGMMNVPPQQVAFMRNTSDGLASVANGINWKQGDNIVTFENEFPSNYYAWKMVRDSYGVELRIVRETNGRIDLTELTNLIDTRTRVVALSAVQFASGFRTDLERVGKAARERDALFVVDIIQSLGAAGFDLPAQYVDIAAGASHKWLCAPEGCGFLYLSERARDRVKPTAVGWISVDEPWDFVDREQPFKENALAWESGTGPSGLFYGLEESLKLLTETGLNKIEAHLTELSDHLCERLPIARYELVSSRLKGESSPIICIKHRGGMTSSEIAKALAQQNVVVSPRGDRLRIAPHFYNAHTEIDRLIECLP